jgi:hypothetical protein
MKIKDWWNSAEIVVYRYCWRRQRERRGIESREPKAE